MEHAEHQTFLVMEVPTICRRKRKVKGVRPLHPRRLSRLPADHVYKEILLPTALKELQATAKVLGALKMFPQVHLSQGDRVPENDWQNPTTCTLDVLLAKPVATLGRDSCSLAPWKT